MLTRPNLAKKINAIAVLDIGTSKTACMIVAPGNANTSGYRRSDSARILGFGCKPSRGLKAGVVIDHDGAEQSARAAVMQAEQMAGLTVEHVFMAVTSVRLISRTFAADTRIEGRTVDRGHIERLMAAGRKYAQHDGNALLHINHLGYRLDDQPPVADPLGMSGSMLATDLHAITVDDTPLRSLLNVAERAGFIVTGVAPAPYASGLASTSDEDRRRGVIAVDMGAGATTLSVFSSNRLCLVDAVAVGGQHITFDIARSLSTPFDQAERIKTLYGTLDNAASEDQGMVAYTLAGEEEPALYQTTRTHIRDVVGNRMTGLLTHIAERIERAGVGHLAAQGVVLTGGGSQLPGLGVLAENILARPVRIAHLGPVPELSSACSTPMFATALGLTRIAFAPDAGLRRAPAARTLRQPGYLERVGQWLRKGF